MFYARPRCRSPHSHRCSSSAGRTHEIFTLHVNGELRQDARTSDMVFGIARLIHFASRFYTLYPGDLLYTGTPHGVGPLRPGDLLRAECAPIGAMDVGVRAYRENGG